MLSKDKVGEIILSKDYILILILPKIFKSIVIIPAFIPKNIFKSKEELNEFIDRIS